MVAYVVFNLLEALLVTVFLIGGGVAVITPSSLLLHHHVNRQADTILYFEVKFCLTFMRWI